MNGSTLGIILQKTKRVFRTCKQTTVTTAAVFFFFFGFSGRATKENGRTTGSQKTYRVKKWAFVRMLLDLWSAKQLKRTDLSYKSLHYAALVWHILHHSNHRVISCPNNGRSKHDGQVTYFHLHKNILQVINVLIWSKQEKIRYTQLRIKINTTWQKVIQEIHCWKEHLYTREDKTF